MKNCQLAAWSATILMVAVLIAWYSVRGSYHDEYQEACEQSPDICDALRPKK